MTSTYLTTDGTIWARAAKALSFNRVPSCHLMGEPKEANR